MNTRIFALSLIALLFTSAVAVADTTVTLKEMHLCCGACVKAVNGAVAGIDGAEVAVDKDARTASITASNDEAAQAAVDAISAAGFHGVSNNDKIVVKSDSGAPDGKVKRLEVTNVHNCCGGCNVAIKKAVGTVDGVLASTVQPKESSFVVEGDFDAAGLVKALNAAGFHVKVKQ